MEESRGQGKAAGWSKQASRRGVLCVVVKILLYDMGQINTKEKLKQVMLTSVFHMITIVVQQYGSVALLSTCFFFFFYEDDHKHLVQTLPRCQSCILTKIYIFCYNLRISWYNLSILFDDDTFDVFWGQKMRLLPQNCKILQNKIGSFTGSTSGSKIM